MSDGRRARSLGLKSVSSFSGIQAWHLPCAFWRANSTSSNMWGLAPLVKGYLGLVGAVVHFETDGIDVSL
jgi:hypothetical protein